MSHHCCCCCCHHHHPPETKGEQASDSDVAELTQAIERLTDRIDELEASA